MIKVNELLYTIAIYVILYLLTKLFLVNIMIIMIILQFYCIYLLSKISVLLLSDLLLFLFFFFLAWVSTFLQLGGGDEFNLYQLLRSQLWTFVGIFAFILSSSVNLDIFSNRRFTKVFNVFFLFMCLNLFFGVIDFLYGTNYSINILDRELSKGGRIYLLGVETLPAAIIYLLTNKKYKHLLVFFIVGLLTGGRMVIASSILIPLLFFIKNISMRVINKYTIFYTFVLFLFMGLAIAIIFDREFTINEGNRYYQITTVFHQIYNNLKIFFIGIGFGVPAFELSWYDLHSDLLSPNHAALYENARYDIENGYAYLFYRYGIIGFLIYFLIIYKRSRGVSFIIIPLLLLYFIGTSPVGPSFSLTLLLLGLASSHNRINKKEIN